METTYPTNIDGAAAGGILAVLAGIWIFIILVCLAFFVFWILMLINAIQLDEETYKKIGSGEKTIWLAILGISFFFGFSGIAAIIYYFAIYRNAKNLPNRNKVAS